MSRQTLVGCDLATLATDGRAYGLILDGAVGVDGDRVEWVGARSDLPPEWASVEQVELEGRLVTPALIDCHTHLVYGGNRSEEFEQRLAGVTYAEIAAQGGGIASTVQATRSLDHAALVESALPRLDRMLDDGVGTVEIKSGYGLTIESELEMLRVARYLGTLRPVRIVTTWLAAHAVPPEFEGRPDDYLTEVVLPGLDAAHAEGLVDSVDGFLERIAFSPGQIERVFEHARSLGLPLHLHADQLSDGGGGALAASHEALSADHLEYASRESVRAMAEAGTVAVLLPGAYYTLGETTPPPIDELRTAGVPMAVATDCNPGSSPLESLLLAANMASTLFGLTPEESFMGVTRHAATALGLNHEVGTVEVGKRADLAIWDVEHPSELVYRIGSRPLYGRMSGGDLD